MQWIEHCILWIFISSYCCCWISSDLHIWYDQKSHPTVRGNTFLIQCKKICKGLQVLTVANQWSDLEQVKRRTDRFPRKKRLRRSHIHFICACDIGLFYDHFFRGTGKIVNTWNTSGMFIVLWPITAKIRTRELATKPQTVINVLACRLVFSCLIVVVVVVSFSQHNNIPEIFLVFTVISVWL